MEEHELRARAIYERAVPCSPIGRALLNRYHRSLDLVGRPAERELEYLRELARLVEEIPFETLTLAALTAAGACESGSRFRRVKRRRVANRLIRMLRASGELPSARDTHAQVKALQLIETAPPAGREALAAWYLHRQSNVGPFELWHEIRRLVGLEQVIARHPELDGDAALAWYGEGLRRFIVDCGCPPVTRAANPERCNACGATYPSTPLRQSPSEAKQRAIRAVARRYIDFRQRPTPRDGHGC